MKSKILFASLAAVLAIAACKKEKLEEEKLEIDTTTHAFVAGGAR